MTPDEIENLIHCSGVPGLSGEIARVKLADLVRSLARENRTLRAALGPLEGSPFETRDAWDAEQEIEERKTEQWLDQEKERRG